MVINQWKSCLSRVWWPVEEDRSFSHSYCLEVSRTVDASCTSPNTRNWGTVFSDWHVRLQKWMWLKIVIRCCRWNNVKGTKALRVDICSYSLCLSLYSSRWRKTGLVIAFWSACFLWCHDHISHSSAFVGVIYNVYWRFRTWSQVVLFLQMMVNMKLNEYYFLRRWFHLIIGNADLLDVDSTHLNNTYPDQEAAEIGLQDSLHPLTRTHRVCLLISSSRFLIQTINLE